ncbi:hypothetical protein T492DRAFT_846572 [Pavlovales sp. CCMP2436]|nr:hypothetical protein T492DRAFT_846572 [Pavlovales sp. CCMP2436]
MILRNNGYTTYYEWQEPFIGALDRALEVTGASEIRQHAEHYMADNSSVDPEVEGCFTTRVVTSSIIGANSTFRIVIDRDDPEDESLKSCEPPIFRIQVDCAHFAHAAQIAHPERLSVLKKLESSISWPAEIKFPFNSADLAALEVANPSISWNIFTADIENEPERRVEEEDEHSEDEHSEEEEDVERVDRVSTTRLNIVAMHTTTPEKYRERETLINILEYNGHYMYISNLDKLLSKTSQHCAHCLICTKRFMHDGYKKKRDAHTAVCKQTWKSLFEPRSFAHRVADAGTPKEFAGEEASSLQEANNRKKKPECRTHISYERGCETIYKPVMITADFEAPNITLADGRVEQQCRSIRCQLDFAPGFVVPKELKIDFTDIGDECHVRFIEYLLNNVNKIRRTCAQFEKDTSKITTEQHQNFENSKKCHRCHSEFDEKDKKLVKVLEHCHSTGEYRGAAHAHCCAKFSVASVIRKIPVYFHGGSRYDNQFIWQAFAHPRIQRRIKGCKEKRYRPIEVGEIVLNGERFKTINIGPYQIIDSMSFIASGLESALADLPVERKISLKIAADERAAKMGLDADAMFKAYQIKQIFPYELAWYDNLDELIEPSLAGFQNRLRNAFGKTPEEIEIRMKAAHEKLQLGELNEDGTRGASLADQLEEFKQLTGARTWRDLHDIYLAIDVCGLTDCMRNFRQISIATFGLDPSYFISNSSFAWKAMLRHTKANIELLKSSEMYRHFEAGIRGGLAMTRNRVFTCNNSETPTHDEHADTKHAMYLDANALYGSAMQSKLPEGNFREVDTATFDIDDPKYGGVPMHPGQPCEEWQSDTGAYIECDIKYPEHLHDLHSDYPLLPEPMEVQDPKVSGRAEAGDHQAKRKAATTDADSNYYKLMGNACFGMTSQAPEMALIVSDKNRYVLDKPVFVGQAILDLSKVTMQTFWYRALKPTFPGKQYSTIQTHLSWASLQRQESPERRSSIRKS